MTKTKKAAPKKAAPKETVSKTITHVGSVTDVTAPHATPDTVTRTTETVTTETVTEPVRLVDELRDTDTAPKLKAGKADGLVAVFKDGATIRIDPSCVQAHRAIGWVEV